jgi:hypothetical protein
MWKKKKKQNKNLKKRRKVLEDVHIIHVFHRFVCDLKLLLLYNARQNRTATVIDKNKRNEKVLTICCVHLSSLYKF